MHTLRLMTVAGPFRTLSEHEVKTAADARALVDAHAAANGFTGIKLVSDDDSSLRYTAITPGGRAGRNIAFMDYGYDGDSGV